MGSRAFNIPERFLRHIWKHQYVDPYSLKTTDNKVVRVLASGTMNTDGGPDFLNAVIRIGRATFHGDVELHRTQAEWLNHHHQDDPRYNKVILHVVLERPLAQPLTLVRSGRQIPVLVLSPFLSESIRTLWLKTILDETMSNRQRIPCADQNQSVSAELLDTMIRRLAVERIELKLRRFDERLRELAQTRLLGVHDTGDRRARWYVQGDPDDIPPPHLELTQKDLAQRMLLDQLLYEGIAECAGYSKNQEPFIRLSRAVTLSTIRSMKIENNNEALMAVLLGAAGLLPKLKDVHDREARGFVRQLVNEWKTYRKSYRSAVLHRADWQFFPTRPGNFPPLRIAGVAALARAILCDDLFRKMVEALKNPENPAGRVRAIRTLLASEPHPFWTHHYRFDHPTTKNVRPLGADRTGEIITNALIPLALLYARIFRDRRVREGALQLFESMPPAMENTITRLMQRQLLKERFSLTSVGAQQGVIQLYKFYCREERCAECDVGVVVFGSAGRGS
jgi:hypothetical protein